MHMKKTYKYPPCITPSTFFLAHCCWLFLQCVRVRTWLVIRWVWIVWQMLLCKSSRTRRPQCERRSNHSRERLLQPFPQPKAAPTLSLRTYPHNGYPGWRRPRRWTWFTHSMMTMTFHRLMPPVPKGHVSPRSRRRQRIFWSKALCPWRTQRDFRFRMPMRYQR